MVAVYVLDALKEPLVQSDVVGVLGQDGLYLLGQGIHLVVGLGREEVEEHRRHALQEVVVALGLVVLVDDGVVEGGLRRVVDGLLYLLVVAAYAFHEGRLEVFETYAVEGYGVVWGAVGHEKRVLPFGVVLCHK